MVLHLLPVETMVAAHSEQIDHIILFTVSCSKVSMNACTHRHGRDVASVGLNIATLQQWWLHAGYVSTSLDAAAPWTWRLRPGAMPVAA